LPAGLGDVGFATVHDHAGRAKHDIDVIAVDQNRITLIGEAKATVAERTMGDLQRLDHIKDVLSAIGHDARRAVVAIFSTTGFTAELRDAAASRHGVELIDLDRLYAG
jgi:hypothetical protein